MTELPVSEPKRRRTYARREQPSKPPPTSARDMDYFRAIVAYKRENDGSAPSIRDLMRLCAVATTSGVAFHLDRLEAAGLIERLGPNRIRVIGGRWTFTEPEAHGNPKPN